MHVNLVGDFQNNISNIKNGFFFGEILDRVLLHPEEKNESSSSILQWLSVNYTYFSSLYNIGLLSAAFDQSLPSSPEHHVIKCKIKVK